MGWKDRGSSNVAWILTLNIYFSLAACHEKQNMMILVSCSGEIWINMIFIGFEGIGGALATILALWLHPHMVNLSCILCTIGLLNSRQNTIVYLLAMLLGELKFEQMISRLFDRCITVYTILKWSCN